MDSAASARRNRRNAACDECKRRKVRCSADPVCTNCIRDSKVCNYSSPSQRVSVLQRTVDRYESLIDSIKRVWALYMPDITLEQALGQLHSVGSDAEDNSPQQTVNQQEDLRPTNLRTSTDAGSNSDVAAHAEQSNAEDYEFDESQDFGDSIDGMAFLTIEKRKAGYTGPQSGIAALKVLQSLNRAGEASETALQIGPNELQTSTFDMGSADSFINDYFTYYHPAYPILHEGLFRARLSGAVSKPRDGSWPLLYNMVIAMGAFSGASDRNNIDWEYYKIARETISLVVIDKGSLGYVQGLTIMSNYLQKRNKPNAGFSLVGWAWSMSLAIGLHREFGDVSTTPYTMELRRRTWWTLFVFVSGVQLTLGRPPASLIGVNVRLPTNLDDNSLVVDMSELPGAQEGPTVTTCLIAQAKLAQIANAVQGELLTNQVPASQRVEELTREIGNWRAELPTCFEEQYEFPAWFELPKRVLLWRAFHLQIVLNRPSLFQAVAEKADLLKSDGPVSKCIDTADVCIASICHFLEQNTAWRRGFAWYATYWLISASFVHATCFAYMPTCTSSSHWKTRLEQAVKALGRLNSAHPMAGRAQRILERLLYPSDQQYDLRFSPDSQGFGDLAPGADAGLMNFTYNYLGFRDQDLQNLQTPHPGASSSQDGGAQWLRTEAPTAELLDAAGGITLQNYGQAWEMM